MLTKHTKKNEENEKMKLALSDTSLAVLML
uniref:Uncharacterized protein n=1 Tax=Anguilla anguilla TaxID=7936 RepID=A0A0E9SAA4_ANGAN